MMGDSAFELVGNTSIRIEDKQYSCHWIEKPVEGKYHFLLEGTSDKRDKLMQHLFVHDFINVFPADLPNGIQVTFCYPKYEFRNVSFAYIRKYENSSSLSITLEFIYSDWHFPLSLQHFADIFCEKLRHRIDGIIEAEIESEESVGLFVSCKVSARPNVSFWDAYKKLEAQLLATYRSCLDETSVRNTPILEVSAVQSQEESAARWWIRNVVVPLIGSGAVAAIVAAFWHF